MRLVSTILGVLICSFGYAQKLPNAEEGYDILKNSLLLVRINEHTNQIDALKRASKSKALAELQMEVRKTDLEIRTVFKSEYTYGKVYFFYSSDSKSILDGRWEGYIFDADSQIVNIQPCPFLMAEFGETQGARIHGLVIHAPTDEGFTQMKKPFPYFMRRSTFLGLYRRTTGEIVRLWNEDLLN